MDTILNMQWAVITKKWWVYKLALATTTEELGVRDVLISIKLILHKFQMSEYVENIIRICYLFT